MAKTKIEWCDYTINPIRVKGGGWHCTKCSPGCLNCYAETLNKRFGNGKPYDDAEAEYELDLSCFDKLPKTKGKIVFVQSMSDLFHERIPLEFAGTVMTFCEKPEYSHHKYLLLTKRPESILPFCQYPENVWLGVSVSTQAEANKKIPRLLRIPAAGHFVSVEPQLEFINIRRSWLLDFGYPMSGAGSHYPLKWILNGAETGPGAREFKDEWGLMLADRAAECGVPHLFKKHANGVETLNGKLYREIPRELKNESDI